MKKVILIMMAAVMMCGCEKAILPEDGVVEEKEGKELVDTKKFTFTIKGDFEISTEEMRGYLQADGQDMTDLWVFDYVGDECVQSLHQTATDEDWGQPTMHLTYGTHHVYFVASRGVTPTVDEVNNTIVWGSVRDTFWKDYEVTVLSTSNGNRAVTMDRVITKLRMLVTDQVPATAATISMTPVQWYMGLNYRTGAPVGSVENHVFTVSIPAALVGTSGQLAYSVFGFSTEAEWTTDVHVAVNSSSAVLGEAAVDDVPLKANRVTNFSGSLFSLGSRMDVSLNSTWADAYNGTW